MHRWSVTVTVARRTLDTVCALWVLGSLLISIAQAAIVPVSDESTWRNALASQSEVDFEMFTGPVSGEYGGIVFSPFNDGSPNAVEMFSHSGGNSMFTVEVPYGGGGWAADLATPAAGFAFWTGDLEFPGTTVSIYDSQSNLLGTFDLMDVGGGNGPYVYGFNGFVSDSADIARVEVTIDPADAVWFDDVQFGALGTASVTDDTPASRVSSWGRLKAAFRR